MKFSEKLKRLRIESGLTIEELGNQLGLSRKTIGKYEHGHCKPKNDSIYIKIADFFNVDVSDLKNDSDDEFYASVEENYGLKARLEAEEVISNFQGLFAGGRLSEEDREGVIKAIQEIFVEIQEKEKS